MLRVGLADWILIILLTISIVYTVYVVLVYVPTLTSGRHYTKHPNYVTLCVGNKTGLEGVESNISIHDSCHLAQVIKK